MEQGRNPLAKQEQQAGDIRKRIVELEAVIKAKNKQIEALEGLIAQCYGTAFPETQCKADPSR